MAGKRAKKPKRSAGAPTSADKTGAGETCFVLMPFGGWFDQYYELVFRPAIEATGLAPKRADDIYRPGTIVNDIWAFTKAAKLLLADLTDRNPNVFYELGLAHALAKPVILVTDSIDEVPFDLRALRVIEYDKNDPTWGEVLRDKITKAIHQVVEAPLEAVLPAFLRVEERAKRGTVTEQEKGLLELRRDIDLLRREIQPTRIREPDRIVSVEEAEVLIRRFVGIGMPDRHIIRRLVERGVPPSWAEERLAEIRPQSAPPQQPETKPEKAVDKSN